MSLNATINALHIALFVWAHNYAVVPAPLQDQINEGKLKQESIRIERKFSELVLCLQKSLERQNISVYDIFRCVLAINCMTQVYKSENQCMFRKKRRQLESCSTISEMWRILCDYVSFFDFYIIELITSELGTEEDGLHLGQYKAEFKKYLNNRVFPIKIVHSQTPRDDIIKMILKLDSSYDDCDLAHLEDLKETVATMLKLEPYCVQLQEVQQGCIQLVLSIPEFIVDSIFPLTPDQELTLHQLKVTKLDCGTFHFGKDKKSKLYCI